MAFCSSNLVTCHGAQYRRATVHNDDICSSGFQDALTACCAMQLTVSDWPAGFASVGFDSVLANEGHLGTGLEIRDNVIAHNRGRGLLIKAGGGVVIGNSIINPAWWGIMVRPSITSLLLLASILPHLFNMIPNGLCRCCQQYDPSCNPARFLEPVPIA